jgi:thiaminase
MTLFARLKGDNQSTWHAYINHKFVTELAGGTLKIRVLNTIWVKIICFSFILPVLAR